MKFNKQQFDKVTDELVRAVAQKEADLAMDVEQEMRINKQQFDEVADELVRSVAKKAAISAMNAEQQRRIAQQASVGKDFTGYHDILDDIARLGARKQADEAYGQAKAEQVHEQKFKDICEEIRRVVATHFADKATEEEKERRIATENFRSTLSDIQRIGNLWNVYHSTDVERTRRMNAPPPSEEQLHLKFVLNQALSQTVPPVA